MNLNKKFFRFAEQLRAAGMSMSNNIAEGSESRSKKVFVNYLEHARNSIFIEYEKIGFRRYYRNYIGRIRQPLP